MECCMRRAKAKRMSGVAEQPKFVPVFHWPMIDRTEQFNAFKHVELIEKRGEEDERADGLEGDVQMEA